MMTAKKEDAWAEGTCALSTVRFHQSQDSEVAAALEEYFTLLEQGQKPGRAEFLERHRSIADSLVECLDGLEFVNKAAGEFSPSSKIAGPMTFPTFSPILGDFRLIREIGRGGMGIVYEAEQLSLARRVALKVLPSGAALDPRRCERFQVEAQAAAVLHHDHIVPVYGVGSDQGAHYFAMQLIDGPSLTQVIGDLKAETSPETGDKAPLPEGEKPKAAETERPAPPRSSIHSSLARARCRETARLGIQAALALEHAHQLGVIHRDIKPSNLLIDGRGKLWVADFGLARLPKEDHDLTQTGDLVGTIRYMSPEQVRAERGGVDCSTDIYSLGVTLYELTTLRPVFTAPDRQELLRSILHDEPRPLRKVNPTIPRDLETIILKAIEKEPSARYASALALADDLKHFLADEPVRARRPGPVDRTVKWIRRHKAAVVISTSALIVTLAATAVLLWQAKRRTDATLAEYRKSVALQRMGVEYALAALDQITHPLGSRARAGSAASRETRRILPSAISYYDRIPGLFGDVEMVKEAVAKAHRQAGFSRMALGHSKGRDDYRQAIELYEHLAAQYPERIWLRTGLIETLHEYSSLLTAEEDNAEARARFLRALEVAESLIGNEEAARHCYTMGLVGPVCDLAWDLVKRPTVQSAAAQRAVRLSRQATAWEPDQAACWRVLGVAYFRLGEWSPAESALGKSMDLDKTEDPADLFFLAAIDHRRGNQRQARRYYHDALALMQRNSDQLKDRQDELRRIRDEIAAGLSE
jgi:serine/threonine protein kinase/tetratricopeptide (TPR) repeat protein